MTIAREEIFGPVLATITFKTMDDALKLANESSYGLEANVFTADLSKAHKMARALKAGVVTINTRDIGGIEVPFGGYKQSGFGRGPLAACAREVHAAQIDLYQHRLTPALISGLP
jgi:acyl-CoA reductase-like NAD-dependent aldehyde dehydrogenase